MVWPKKKVYVLVGTHKGAFIFSSDEGRKKWSMKGPLLKGADVNEIILDTRREPTLLCLCKLVLVGIECSHEQRFWKDMETVRFR